MQKLQVGIIGAGLAFERLHYPAYQKLNDKYEIVALCDVDPPKCDKWSHILGLPCENLYQDWQELLKRQDLDVIDIMVPLELNFKITREVARQETGKKVGIICEKPLAPDLPEAKAARDLAVRYQLPVMIAETFRYSEEYSIIRDFVRTKHVGDVYYFIQNHADDFPAKMIKDTFQAKEWRQHPEYPGGAITDTAVHDIAGLRHIFGPVAKLHAFGIPTTADYSPYAVVTVNLEFVNGIIGQYAFFASGKEAQRPLTGLRIFGADGMIYLEEPAVGIINIFYNDGHQEQIPYQPDSGFRNELLNFYNVLTGREAVSVPPEMEYGDLKTIHDILASIEDERIVAVDKTDLRQPSYFQEHFYTYV